MKFKYYLRGLGIGIIVTTIILAISFSGKTTTLSDEEIMEKAAQLGMVMPEDEKDPVETETQTPQTETQMPQTETQMPQTETQMPQTETQMPQEDEGLSQNPTGVYRLTIQSGDVCRIVCENLQTNGVIENAEALRSYLFEIGYASSLSTGEYDIPYGLSMEAVAEILQNGPIQ